MKIDLDQVKKILKYQLIVLVGIFLILDGWLFYRLYNLFQTIEIVDKNIAQQNNYIEKNQGNSQAIEELIYPIAVIIDNHLEAWPNYGLSLADIVYEVPVEGGVTRFLAIYIKKNKAVDKIGPVRSARPYLVELAKEYNALLAHAGGSPQALNLIEKLKIHNLEEIAWWGPDYFWRVHSRPMPHNLFTSLEKLLKALIDWGLDNQTADYRKWKIDSLNKNGRELSGQLVTISFSESKDYQIEYKYQSSTKEYLRYQSNQKHIDALNNKQIAVDNLIIQIIQPKKIIDELGRLKLNLIGQGKAMIFINGQYILAKWIKISPSGRTIFYNQQNKEVKFKPGNTWIEIVPEDIKVKWEE